MVRVTAAKNEPWSNTCDRFVAFLDILGFTERVSRESHKTVLDTLMSLRPVLNRMERDANETLDKFRKLQSQNKLQSVDVIVRPVTFSDSILLVSSDDSDVSLFVLSMNVNDLVTNAMSLNIPIKGAIAFGMQTADFDQSLYFGQPLIDAFHLQDEIELYSVVLHHTVERRLAQMSDPHSFDGVFLRYPTPLRSGKVSHLHVPCQDTQQISGQIQNLYRTVSGSARRYVDNTAEYAEWLHRKERPGHV